MAFISVTRLRVRSYVYLPKFVWEALNSARQAQCSSGFLGGKILRNARNVFWTVTAWNDESAMNAYREGGAHRSAMPKLLNWCDEAAVAHWTHYSEKLPSWLEAHRHVLLQGRLSKVNHPSPGQVLSQIPAPEPGHFRRTLAPASRT